MNLPKFNDYYNSITKNSHDVSTKQAKCLCPKCHGKMFEQDNMIICITVIPPIYIHTLICEDCGHIEKIEERSGSI